MNPVVETFAELFEKLKDRSGKVLEAAEKAQPKQWSYAFSTPWNIKKTTFSSGVSDVIEFTEETFEQALNQAQLFPGSITKTPGDTVRYDVNDPATWANFVSPEEIDWSFEVPKKQRKVRGNKKV